MYIVVHIIVGIFTEVKVISSCIRPLPFKFLFTINGAKIKVRYIQFKLVIYVLNLHLSYNLLQQLVFKLNPPKKQDLLA